jgi:histone H3/H4
MEQPTSNTPNRTLAEMIEQANAELQQEGQAEFSESAFVLVKEKVAAYTVELAKESSRRAKRHKADIISAADVEKADEYLISPASQKAIRNIGTIGGIILGMGLSNALAIVTTNQFSPLGIAITVASCIIGTAMVVYQFSKD